MTELLSYVIRGFPIGCVFALMAVGVVLTYKTSGVFNLAFGAQAFVSAAVYYETRVRHDWPIPLAFLLAAAPIVCTAAELRSDDGRSAATASRPAPR